MSASPIVYCSGPLFSPEEVAAMTVVARELEGAGFATFVPHRDGVEAFVMPLANTPLDSNFLRLRDAIDKAIFAVDVFQIVERCAAVVVNANGRVPDEGAVAEAAIAFATGVPVVIYKRDARAPFRGRDNAMLTGLATVPTVSELSAIPASVDKALAGHVTATRPAKDTVLAATVDRGRRLWSLLAGANRLRGRVATPDAVATQIAEWIETAPTSLDQ
jgi:nucleoside 2-deoxyribosyltransferase